MRSFNDPPSCFEARVCPELLGFGAASFDVGVIVSPLEKLADVF
jgi:hypothetical protein